MADEADRALVHMEREMEQLIQAAVTQGTSLHPVGECHFCGNDLGDRVRLFCNGDCASENEYLEQRARANRR